MKKKVLVSVGTLFGLLLLISIGGGFYMLNYALCPQMISVEKAELRIRKNYPDIVPWMDSLRKNRALCDTFITSQDGQSMHAFYVKAKVPTRKTAVIVHGYTDQAMEMMHIGCMYHRDLLCNILLPDLRYAGLSSGEAIQMGWKDREDVLQWIGVAPALFGDSVEIVVHGISMGAATTMMVAGENVPESVKCCIADCGYTSVWDQFSKELKEQFGLPEFPLLYVANELCEWKYGWNFKEASAVRQVEHSSLPIFFIHGDQDDYVPTRMVYELYEAKPAPKKLWVTRGVDHAHSYKIYPKAYTDSVSHFIGLYW